MQAARRSATRRRCSTSRKTRMPPSDDNRPPSNLATTVLPETGDRPGSGSIRSIMAGVVSRKWHGLASAPISYAKSAPCATSANLQCIIRARWAWRSALLVFGVIVSLVTYEQQKLAREEAQEQAALNFILLRLIEE